MRPRLLRSTRAVAAGLLAAGALAAAAAAGLPLAPLASAGKLVPAPSAPMGPEGVPVPRGTYLAAPANHKLGQTVDGVTCQRAETVAFHVHAHLTIFVRGTAVQIPFGVGIGGRVGGVNTKLGPFVTVGSCFMWLHTHALDGVIHIEAPKVETFTLGQFFAVWGQPLTRTRVGPARGAVVAFYDGRVWTGALSAIPLRSEAQIQLDVGTPRVAPVHIAFPKSLAASMTKG